MERRELLALYGALVAGAGTATGCLGDETAETPTDAVSPDVQTTTDAPDNVIQTLVKGNNAFAFDLFHELADDSDDGNVFVSPYSVAVALGMTYAGAGGDTAEEMGDALRFEVEAEDLHAAFASLEEELESRSDVDDSGMVGDGDEPPELTVANRLWGHDGFGFQDDFIELLNDEYGAGLERLDFSDAEDAAETVNDWVADETEDRIDELVDATDLDASTVLVLTNAVYFSAGWEMPFAPASTEDAEFTSLDGTTTTVRMMEQRNDFEYAEVGGHEVLELPYVGGDLSMVVVLPSDGFVTDGYDGFEASLDSARLDELVGATESRRGEVRMPRFSFESDYVLNDHLQELGMREAFSSDADLSGIGEGDLFIEFVVHDTFVDVNEEGTEAAAATAVGVEESEPPDPFEMTVDRPFFFAIRDRPTDSVLFLGRVTDGDGFES